MVLTNKKTVKTEDKYYTRLRHTLSLCKSIPLHCKEYVYGMLMYALVAYRYRHCISKFAKKKLINGLTVVTAAVQIACRLR